MGLGEYGRVYCESLTGIIQLHPAPYSPPERTCFQGTLTMAFNTTCDGVGRRDFLKVGALGTGLTLAGYLRWAAASEQGNGPKLKAKAKSAILINLGGGPSHTDTFDLKPTAPTEYRGSFTADQDERQRHPHLRALAQTGRLLSAFCVVAERHAFARRARAGNAVRAHRQPAVGVAAISELWLGRQQRVERTAGPAVHSWRFQIRR